MPPSQRDIQPIRLDQLRLNSLLPYLVPPNRLFQRLHLRALHHLRTPNTRPSTPCPNLHPDPLIHAPPHIRLHQPHHLAPSQLHKQIRVGVAVQRRARRRAPHPQTAGVDVTAAEAVEQRGRG